MNQITSTTEGVDHNRECDGYEDLLVSIRWTFAAESGPLFTTNADNLWAEFLANIPESARQHYTCHACQHFVMRFGGLVRIAEDGVKAPALWGAVPEFFTPAVDRIKKLIATSKVNGVFVSSLAVYGEPVTGEWHHMAVTPATNSIWRSLTQTADQRAAEKREDYKTLLSGLLEYPIEAVTQAVKLLKTDALYRSEKVFGVAEWLFDLQARRNATKNSAVRDNITWLAVATAPAGFCHIKSSMIGTLLDDIVAGMDFDTVASRFAAKMHPLQYQRPQAAPTAGNIAQAEKIMEQLGAAGALERRFARVDEIKAIWRPGTGEVDQRAPVGVFAHLTPRGDKLKVSEIAAPPQVMTWLKFSTTVLPDALAIDFFANDGPNNYSAITTAARADAPPILQWDSLGDRNPFSGYVYNGGSYPGNWNLTPGWCRVTAICYIPSMWKEGFDHQAKGVYFILDGAKDTRYRFSGNAIFPETLKAEFHSIRATIEAYSRSAVLGGYEEELACGVRVEGKSWDITLRVTSPLGVTSYKLDRWD